MENAEEKPMILHTDDMIKLGNKIRRLESELEKAQEGGRVSYRKCITIGDKLTKAENQLEAGELEIEAVRVALGAYPDSDLESLAKLYHDIYTFRTARCDSGDCETLEMYRRRIPIRIERSPVCLGCGKTHTECKCTDEEIEYHKRLEREQKAE